LTDKRQIANFINNYFKSVFTSHELNDPTPNLQTRTDKTFSINPFASFSSMNVEKYLTELDTNKATGPDKISPLILKNCASAVSFPLSLIFIKSYIDGVLPEHWKEANVTPLHKGGSRTEVTNFRPVSLTSIICKLMEKIIKNELMTYLLQNKLISDKQHGFLPGKSCTTKFFRISRHRHV
jgi:hypothetical protein